MADHDSMTKEEREAFDAKERQREREEQASKSRHTARTDVQPCHISGRRTSKPSLSLCLYLPAFEGKTA